MHVIENTLKFLSKRVHVNWIQLKCSDVSENQVYFQEGY